MEKAKNAWAILLFGIWKYSIRPHILPAATISILAFVTYLIFGDDAEKVTQRTDEKIAIVLQRRRAKLVAKNAQIISEMEASYKRLKAAPETPASWLTEMEDSIAIAKSVQIGLETGEQNIFAEHALGERAKRNSR